MVHAAKLVEEKLGFVLYLQGKTAADDDQYVYIALKAKEAKALDEQLQRGEGETDVTQWGTVLAHGMGFPTDELKAYMQQHYGVQHDRAFDYKAQLREAVKAYRPDSKASS